MQRNGYPTHTILHQRRRSERLSLVMKSMKSVSWCKTLVVCISAVYQQSITSTALVSFRTRSISSRKLAGSTRAGILKCIMILHSLDGRLKGGMEATIMLPGEGFTMCNTSYILRDTPHCFIQVSRHLPRSPYLLGPAWSPTMPRVPWWRLREFSFWNIV